MYSSGAWCGAWFAPGQNHRYHGFCGAEVLLSAMKRDRLVGQVLGQVVAVLRQGGLVDVVVVLDERRVPVVGLAADEAVEAVEAARQRPVALRRAHRPLVERHVVVLADPEGVVAVLAQHLADRGVLHRDVAGVAREALGALGDLGEPVLVVVAPGEQARAGRRAQRRGVPLRVGQPVVGQLLHRRHVDAPAVRRPGGQPGVVVQHEQHVGGALGGRRLPERRPVRDRVPDVDVHHAVELLGHCSSSRVRWCHRHSRARAAASPDAGEVRIAAKWAMIPAWAR